MEKLYVFSSIFANHYGVIIMMISDGTCANLKGQDMTKAYIVREGNCAGVGSVCPSS